MSFETALRARIKAGLADPSVSASVEWDKRPQGSFDHAIVLTSISAPRDATMAGFDKWQSSRLQIDVMGLDKAGVRARREAVIGAIEPAGVFGGVRFGKVQRVSITDLSEQTDTDFVFRDMIELTLWHLET